MSLLRWPQCIVGLTILGVSSSSSRRADWRRVGKIRGTSEVCRCLGVEVRALFEFSAARHGTCCSSARGRMMWDIPSTEGPWRGLMDASRSLGRDEHSKATREHTCRLFEFAPTFLLHSKWLDAQSINLPFRHVQLHRGRLDLIEKPLVRRTAVRTLLALAHWTLAL